MGAISITQPVSSSYVNGTSKLKDPKKILERSKEPLITPTLDWEKGIRGHDAEVQNVTMGFGLIPLTKNILRLYYAGGDMHTGGADFIFKNAEILDKPFFLN